jgi:hypothetical protein
MSEIETIREALKTADWRELRVVESQEAHEALDALEVRLKDVEQALAEIAAKPYRAEEVTARLARQPPQEQPVPCDQHDAGHQAGWA